jgi:hypothetical protein
VRARPVLSLVAVALVATACGDDSPDPSESPASSSPATQTPGDAATTWSPTVPDRPADEAEVQSTYDAALDAATASVVLPWSDDEVRTGAVEGTCAVTVERGGDGTITPLTADELADLAEAVAAHGFDDLAMADDPGGAVRYLAHDDAGALLELRSKDVTTMAVHVPTTPGSCTG